MKPETVFRKRVTTFLKTLKHTVSFPIQQMGIRGTADFHLCSNGLFVSLELKESIYAQESSSRALQEYSESEVKRCGGIAIVAAPENWKSVKAQLRKLDEGELDVH